MSAKTRRNTGTMLPSARGNEEAALSHQREKADGLESHRLAAGVGTRDDEDRGLGAYEDRHRDGIAVGARGVPSISLSLRHEKGVSRFPKLQPKLLA